MDILHTFVEDHIKYANTEGFHRNSLNYFIAEGKLPIASFRVNLKPINNSLLTSPTSSVCSKLNKCDISVSCPNPVKHNNIC